MKKRLLTIKEIDKLVQLGYMKYSSHNNHIYAYVTNKARRDFSNIIDGGLFLVDKLNEFKNKTFKYPNISKECYYMNHFLIINYKFYYFWRKALGGEKEINFKEIEL